MVTNYTGTGIDDPEADRRRPRRGPVVHQLGNNSIGRITTTVTPQIDGVTPTSAAAGATVTLTGQNLAGATDVAFNGTPAAIVADSATKIVTKVPSGATRGRITITTRYGTATSAAPFTVN